MRRWRTTLSKDDRALLAEAQTRRLRAEVMRREADTLRGVIERYEKRLSETLEQIAADAARLDACKELLHTLPERDALILRLHYVSGISDVEIARQLDLTPRHVVRVRRCYMERRGADDKQEEEEAQEQEFALPPE